MFNPVYGAINQPLAVFGVDRTIFMSFFLLSVFIFWTTSLIPGLAVFFVLFTATAMATRQDPKLPEIVLATAKMGRLYE